MASMAQRYSAMHAYNLQDWSRGDLFNNQLSIIEGRNTETAFQLATDGTIADTSVRILIGEMLEKKHRAW